ncbi:MAG: AraC family transcriptional regulator, partial [Oscillospiraceae bacterium]|nr:AraC family transcriptional regulator [Oscillospiraceae bacterium]
NDINTHKPFFRSGEWATWTLRLTDAHFGAREDGTDLWFVFGADPDDICYIRSIKVYVTDRPENYAFFSAMEMISRAWGNGGNRLELNLMNREQGFVAHAIQYTLPVAGRRGVEIICGGADGRVSIDGAETDYHAGDILLINGGQIRGAGTNIPGGCFYLIFDLSMLGNPGHPVINALRTERLRFQNRVPASHPAHEMIWSVCNRLTAVYSQNDQNAMTELRLQVLLLELLIALYENGLVEENNGRHQANSQIRQVIEYMEKHLGEPLTVNRLATLANLSEGYFSRQFRASVGVPPLAHLTALRIQRAAALLTEGLSVTETAMEVGIPHVSHFIRLFKQRFGVTPHRWRIEN